MFTKEDWVGKTVTVNNASEIWVVEDCMKVESETLLKVTKIISNFDDSDRTRIVDSNCVTLKKLGFNLWV